MKPVKRSVTTYPNHVEPPVPIRGRRLSGDHWWDPDRLSHLDDMPRHCPGCGEGMGRSIAVEYWEGDSRIYHVWCRSCGWAGEIIRVHRMIGHEAEH